MYVLDSQGRLKWRHYTRSKVHSIFAIDLDGDGEVEILLASDAKDLYAMTSDRQEKWRFAMKSMHLDERCDLNNDGCLGFCGRSEDEHVYFWTLEGIWSGSTLGNVFWAVYGIDLNRDGIQEIIVGAEDDRVRVLRVELIGGLLGKTWSAIKFLALRHPIG